MPAGKRYTVTVETRPDSPCWQARLYLEGEAGRARRWSTGIPVGTDRRVSERVAQEKANARAAEIAGQVEEITTPPSDDPSLDAALARMLEQKRADGSRKRNVDALAWNFDKNVRPYFGRTRDVRTMKRRDLEAFKLHLLQKYPSPTSVNNALTCIRQILDHACKIDELIDSVPYVGNVEVPKRSKVAKPITREQARKFLESFTDDEAREFNLFLLETGLRKFEALALQWDWIEWEAGLIHIPGEVRKGGREQRMPTILTPAVLKLLQERRARPKQPSKGRVFFQLKGGRKGARDYDQERRAAAARAGITGYRHHDARHTLATWLGREGATGVDLRDRMNWETLAMVSRYTHPDLERARQLAARVTTGIKKTRHVTGSVTGEDVSRGKDTAPVVTAVDRHKQKKRKHLRSL